MAARRSRVAARTHEVLALVLRRVELGESDLVVSLFTDQAGALSALARGARRSQRRFGGALEPFHTLRARLEEREGRDLWTITEASISLPRHRLVESLPRLEAAGRAVAWVRAGVAERSPEPGVWRGVTEFLDAIDAAGDDVRVQVELAELGLRLLGHFGWGLELDQCVRCGKVCEPNRAATVDAARGGLVCRACGGAKLLLRGAERVRLVRAIGGERGALVPKDASRALELVDDAMRTHTGKR